MKMKFPLVFGVFATLLLISIVEGSGEIDVEAEIQNLSKHLENFEKPSPEVLDSFFEQIANQCQNNKTIDQSTLVRMSECMAKQFNDSSNLVNEIQGSVSEGTLDQVFRDMCLKWPKLKTCLSELFVIIDECWNKGTQVNKALDSMVDFFCGVDNNGERIALFIAEGGLKCLETQGDELKACIEAQNPEDAQEDLCSSIIQLDKCAYDKLRKCEDSTPENLVTSMLRQVGKAVDCPIREHYKASETAGAWRIDASIAALAIQAVLIFI